MRIDLRKDDFIRIERELKEREIKFLSFSLGGSEAIDALCRFLIINQYVEKFFIEDEYELIKERRDFITIIAQAVGFVRIDSHSCYEKFPINAPSVIRYKNFYNEARIEGEILSNSIKEISYKKNILGKFDLVKSSDHCIDDKNSNFVLSDKNNNLILLNIIFPDLGWKIICKIKNIFRVCNEIIPFNSILPRFENDQLNKIPYFRLKNKAVLLRSRIVLMARESAGGLFYLKLGDMTGPKLLSNDKYSILKLTEDLVVLHNVTKDVVSIDRVQESLQTPREVFLKRELELPELRDFKCDLVALVNFSDWNIFFIGAMNGKLSCWGFCETHNKISVNKLGVIRAHQLGITDIFRVSKNKLISVSFDETMKIWTLEKINSANNKMKFKIKNVRQIALSQITNFLLPPVAK